MASFPSLLFLLSDGIQGHVSQSRGVAGWISRFTGADVVEMEVPQFSGWGKIRLLKLKSRALTGADKIKAERWLKEVGGGELLEAAQKKLDESSIAPGNALFLSAGSGAAPFTLALARVLGHECCTIMTPSVLGASSFDFAIIPRHDHPRENKNTLVTLGAPNAIFPDQLERSGWELAQRYPPAKGREAEKWALLLGGDDENYRLSPEWIRRSVAPILEAAVKTDAEIFITTSRRTSPDAEEVLARLTRSCSVVRMLLLASKDPLNPVPGMLGLCSRVFVTEDSVSMISEAVTGGHVVQILRVERKRGLRKCLQDLTAKMVDKNLMARKRLWGIPRFNLMIESFYSRGLAMEYDPARIDQVSPARGRKNEGLSFNEARRAAEWIIQGWKS